MYVVLYKRPAREGVVLQEKGSTQEKGGGGLDVSQTGRTKDVGVHEDEGIATNARRIPRTQEFSGPNAQPTRKARSSAR